jgi:spore maturation protein CgeB
MCYNDCRLFPSTIDLIKKHVKKLIVLLGDNPFFYNKDKRYFLYLIEKSDIIISADKTTINYLNLYHKTTLFYPAGTDNSVFFPVVPNRFELNLYSCDILFVGTGYGNNSFGYHRARVLSEIADFNIKIYGDKHWKKHISFFPKLRDKIIYKKLSQFELNIAHNCTKIVIVPTNAWLVNGIPTRVFDALASGTFVIAEHRELYDEIFPDKIVPTYKSVNELKSVVSYYLLHDNERINKVNKSRNIVISNYLVKHNVSKFIEYL